jgi:hypothetical protein
MYEIFLDPKFVGIDSYLFISKDGKICTKASRDKNSYFVSTKEHCANNLFDLFPSLGIECKHFADDSLVSAYETVYGDNVSWLRALGKKRFVKDIGAYLKKLQSLISEFDEMNYLPTLARGRKILESLESAYVDSISLKKELQVRDIETLRSLIPVDGNECEIVKYSHASQTGRLTVSSGPRVLTLKKEDRSFFRSSREDKMLCRVDFISLEPRVTYLLTRPTSPKDIYEEMKVFTGSSASRANLKIATLSTLYGSSKIDPALSRSVSKFFDVEKIKKDRLSDTRLFNLYGRPLNPEEDWLRLSHYVQSTAVDVALLGFTNFYETHEITPLFLIHDELVFECDKEVYEELSNKELYVDVEPLGRFYLELNEFGKDN